MDFKIGMSVQVTPSNGEKTFDVYNGLKQYLEQAHGKDAVRVNLHYVLPEDAEVVLQLKAEWDQ